MAKLSLNKTIEAKKLDLKTGVPTTDPEVTIPFGAIIDNIKADRDMERFTFLGEPYRCKHDILASALPPGALEGKARPPAPAAAAAQPQATPAQAGLQWEPLESSHYSLMRAKVPGGWLVAAGNGAGLTFYPDPRHQWDGASVA